VQYRTHPMLMQDQHLFKSPAMEVYGFCRLQLPWLRVPSWFFFYPGLKNCWHGWIFVLSQVPMTSQPRGPHMLDGHLIYSLFTIIVKWLYHNLIIFFDQHSMTILINTPLHWSTLTLVWYNPLIISPHLPQPQFFPLKW